jgi:putative ABC transport system substrate-binding protein
MAIGIGRRQFIFVLGGGAVAWPLAARAQQSAMPVIGFLNSASPKLYADRVLAFRQGLSENGYVEDRNVAIEYRWAENQFDRLPELANDLVRRHVNVIVTGSNLPAALAAKAATATIPIVFTSGVDPVKAGLVASYNRPGGNITGVVILAIELIPKRMELLYEMVPATKVIAALVNPASPIAEAISRDAKVAAEKIGLELLVLHANTEQDFETAFATLRKLRASGLVITPDSLFISRSGQLAELALRDEVPSIGQSREYAVAGGLLSYGGNLTDQDHQAGGYVGRILKGEKPADLPVVQSTKFETVINLKTAKALGLAVPQTLQVAADEVIE